MKSGEPSVGMVGKCDVASQHFQGCSPYLCRLRTDGLAPVSKYWTYRSHAGVMGPVNRCSILSTNVCLSLQLQWLSWEKNWVVDLRITPPACFELCREPFFSGAVGYIQHYWWLVKGCYVHELPVESIRVRYVDWREKHTCRVYQVFPYRVYIDSNHRDSRIWVPLVYGHQHIAN
jgi:hypothetical protein